MAEISEYTKYVRITNEQLMIETEDWLKNFFKTSKKMWGERFLNIYFDDLAFAEIVERVFKRKIYYHVFHNINGLNKLKEISLYCFWIIKLHPFSWITHHKTSETDYELNVKMALNFFQQGLSLYAKENNKTFVLTSTILQELYYSFRYNDLSKEAIINIANILIK